jgi:hypothetical protein
MGGKSGGGGTYAMTPSYSSQTTTNTPNSTAMDAYTSALQKAQAAGSAPYQAYTGELVAPMNGLQGQAIGQTQGLQGAANPYINSATGMVNNSVNMMGANYGNAVNQYMSPYINDVVNSTMAQMHQNDQSQQNNLLGNAIMQGAMGGDRVGVTQAALAGQQQLADNQTVAGLYNSAYNNASNMVQNAANTGLTGAQQMAALGQEQLNTGLLGTNALLQAGNQVQQQGQNVDTANYGQYQLGQAFPYNQAQWLAGITSAIGPQMGGTSTTSGWGLQGQQNPSTTAQNVGMGLAGLGALGGINYGSLGTGLSSLGSGASSLFGGIGSGLGSLAGLFALKDGGAVPDRASRDTGGGIFDLPEGGGWVPAMQLQPGQSTMPQSQAYQFPGGGEHHNPTTGEAVSKGLEGLAEKFKSKGEKPTGLAAPAQIGGIHPGPAPVETVVAPPSQDNASVEGGNPLTPAARGGLIRQHFADGGDAVDDAPAPAYDPEKHAQKIAGWAKDLGLSPRQAVATARSEGLYNPIGDHGHSFSSFQLNDQGGWGNDFTKETGIHLTPDNIDKFRDMADQWTLRRVAKEGGFKPNIFHGMNNPVYAKYMGQDAPKAMAYAAPERGSGLDAIEAHSRPAGLATAPNAPALAYDDEMPARKGLEPPKEETSGSFLSPEMSQGLMAAGLGMMASRSPYAGVGIGQGGLMGLGAYQNALAAKEESRRNDYAMKRQLAQDAETKRYHDILTAEREEARKAKGSWGVIGETVDELGNPKKIYGWTSGEHAGEQTGGPSLSSGQPATEPPKQIDWSKHGDEFLDQIAPDTQELVKNIASGRGKLPSGFGASKSMPLYKMVVAYDPDFNMTRYTKRNQLTTDYAKTTPGSAGGQLLSANAAIAHAGTALDALDSLGNSGGKVYSKAQNRLTRWWLNETEGDPKAQSVKQATEALNNELEKFFKGGSPAEGAIRRANENLNAAQTPAEYTSALHTLVDLLHGRSEQLEQRWHAEFGKNAAFPDELMDEYKIESDKAKAATEKINRRYQEVNNPKHSDDGSPAVIHPDGAKPVEAHSDEENPKVAELLKKYPHMTKEQLRALHEKYKNNVAGQ